MFLLFGHENGQSWQHWLCQSYHRLRGLKEGRKMKVYIGHKEQGEKETDRFFIRIG